MRKLIYIRNLFNKLKTDGVRGVDIFTPFIVLDEVPQPHS